MKPSHASQELERICPPTPNAANSVLEGLAPPPRKWEFQTESKLIFQRNFLLISLQILLAAILFAYFCFVSNLFSILIEIPILALLTALYISCFYKIHKRYKKRIKNYKISRLLFENGQATPCEINTLTLYYNGDYENIYISQPPLYWKLFGYIRVDYTFIVNKKSHAGSNFLRYRTAKHLHINDVLTVLYNPEDVTQSMIYPIPTLEFSSAFLEKS